MLVTVVAVLVVVVVAVVSLFFVRRFCIFFVSAVLSW